MSKIKDISLNSFSASNINDEPSFKEDEEVSRLVMNQGERSGS